MLKLKKKKKKKTKQKQLIMWYSLDYNEIIPKRIDFSEKT